MNLLESTLKHEGFRSKPYQDSLGVWTVGHGLTYITETESKEIVRARLHVLYSRWEIMRPNYNFAILDVLTEMSFQMGFHGVLNFKKMLAALTDKNYALAADEMLDSRWAKQTPGRAQEMSDIIRGLV